jgi:hypothetical protein
MVQCTLGTVNELTTISLYSTAADIPSCCRFVQPLLEQLMTQSDLDRHHENVSYAVQLWADGLITDLELATLMAEDRSALPADEYPAGLLDPNTGLRYPTE